MIESFFLERETRTPEKYEADRKRRRCLFLLVGLVAGAISIIPLEVVFDDAEEIEGGETWDHARKVGESQFADLLNYIDAPEEKVLEVYIDQIKPRPEEREAVYERLKQIKAAYDYIWW